MIPYKEPTYKSFHRADPFDNRNLDYIGRLLLDIEHFEQIHDYSRRNQAVIILLGECQLYGIKSGIKVDPKEPDWPVVFIEFVEGDKSFQLSWHVQPFGGSWDGHTTADKYARIHELLELRNNGT